MVKEITTTTRIGRERESLYELQIRYDFLLFWGKTLTNIVVRSWFAECQQKKFKLNNEVTGIVSAHIALLELTVG